MNSAFNLVSFNIGLLQSTISGNLSTLTNLNTEVVSELSKIMTIANFSENFPWEDLDVVELSETSYVPIEPANFDGIDDTKYCIALQKKQYAQKLWGKLLKYYLIPASRRLAKFSILYWHGHIDTLPEEEKEAWLQLIEVLDGWKRLTPILPDPYAGLIREPAGLALQVYQAEA